MIKGGGGEGGGGEGGGGDGGGGEGGGGEGLGDGGGGLGGGEGGGGEGGGDGGGEGGGGEGGGEGDATMLPVAPNRNRRPAGLGYLPSQAAQVPALPNFSSLAATWVTSVVEKSTGPVVPGHNAASVTAMLVLPRKLSWIACCCISVWPP